MSRTIHLSWLSHQTAFSTIIPNFRENNNFCDVTIFCNGSYFPAHRIILATFSDYFREILEKVPCRHPFIIIQDVMLEDLKNLLDFIYVGETSVASDRMVTFLMAATKFKIRGLGLAEDSEPSVSDFHETVINLAKEGIEPEATASCNQEIHEEPTVAASSNQEIDEESEAAVPCNQEISEPVIATSYDQDIQEDAHSSLRSERIRLDSGATNEPVKRKLEESENVKGEKRITTDNTKSIDAEEKKFRVKNLEIINPKVVIEICPQAVRMCQNLKNHITVPSAEGNLQAQWLSDDNEDDSFPDDLHAHSEQDFVNTSPLKVEPQNAASSQLESEKNEEHIFSIQNVYSVKGKLEDPSSASQEYSAPLPFSQRQQFHSDQRSDQSHENELVPNSSSFERSGNGEYRMEYFRVKIEPAEDISDDLVQEGNGEMNSENFSKTSAYDFLTTELGPDLTQELPPEPFLTTELGPGSTSSDLTQELPQGQIVTEPKNQLSELRGLAIKRKRSHANELKSKKVIKKTRFGKAKKKLLCSFCPYKTAVGQNMTIHMRVHTGEKPYACTVCPYRSTQQSSLNIHMQQHELESNCQFCPFKTRCKIEMEEHNKTHIEAKSYKCIYCPFSTGRTKSLQNHIKKHDTKVKIYKCNCCPFYTNRNQSLQNHIRKHKREEQKTPDVDSSLGPKNRVKVPLDTYRSRKISILRKKLLVRRRKEALKIKLRNDKVESGIGIGIGVGEVSVESTEGSGSKGQMYTKTENVIDENNSLASTSKLSEVKADCLSISSISDQFTEGSLRRIVREKKLLALNRIKENFEHSGESGAEVTSENSWSAQSDRKKKYKNKRKSKKHRTSMASDGGSTSNLGPVIVAKEVNRSLPPLDAIGTPSIPKAAMVSISQYLYTTLGEQTAQSNSDKALVATSFAKLTPVSASEMVSVPEITPTFPSSVIKIIPSSDLAPKPKIHKKIKAVKPTILLKGGVFIPVDSEENDCSPFRIASCESLSRAHAQSSTVFDSSDGDNIPVIEDVKRFLS